MRVTMENYMIDAIDVLVAECAYRENRARLAAQGDAVSAPGARQQQMA
jgi:hypothetical protein